MYQMLAVRIPFEGKLIAVLKQIISDDPPPPSQFIPGLDQQLEDICLQAMARSIKYRFASAAQLADALHAYLSNGRVHRSEPEEMLPSLRPLTRRERMQSRRAAVRI